MGSDTINLINTLGFPIVSAAFAAVFGYKVVFYVLRDLSGEIRELHGIVVKLIDSQNTSKREICKIEQRLAELREQHRSYTDLLAGDSVRKRVHNSKKREEL